MAEVTGTAEEGSFDPARLDAAFEAVGRQVGDGDVPTAVLGVADRWGIVRLEAFGTQAGRPVPPDGIYLLASITKSILGTAMLQLVEQGRLSLRTPIRAYLPGFRPSAPVSGLPWGELISAQHLLSHTSGIVEPPDETWSRGLTRDAALAYLETAPLRFAPGSEYLYTTITYYLLGELIRRRSGIDYPEFLERHLFAALGMADTAFAPTDEARVVVPLLDPRGDEANRQAMEQFVAAAHPGAGLWSTAADVLRLGRALLAGGTLDGVRVLGSRSIELMTREQTAHVRERGVVDRDPTYGLGWSLPGLDNALPVSRRAFGHGGATGTRLLVDPAAGIALVYLTNVWGIDERHAIEAFGGVLGALRD